VALSREVDARELLVEAYPDVRIRLVVTEANVELGPVALDELLLGQKRLRLGLGDQEVDRSNPADEVEPPAMRSEKCDATRFLIDVALPTYRTPPPASLNM